MAKRCASRSVRQELDGLKALDGVARSQPSDEGRAQEFAMLIPREVLCVTPPAALRTEQWSALASTSWVRMRSTGVHCPTVAVSVRAASALLLLSMSCRTRARRGRHVQQESHRHS